MKQISSIDLYFLVEELKILENQRVDNFYFDNETFYIRTYVKGKGGIYLVNKLSKFLYLDDKKENDSKHPNNFIQFLRKYLRNGFIKEITQVEGERILKITIEKKDDNGEINRFTLILELFANGNIILVDDNMIIKNALEKRKYKDRDILAKQEYEFPPAKELSIFSLDENKFKEELEKEERLSIVKFLAIKFGLGGKFAEEICEKSNIDKNKNCLEITEDERNLLSKELQNLPNSSIDPYVIQKDENPADFIPIDFISIPDEKKKKTASFNDALKEYYTQFKEDIDRREQELLNELKKLEKRLEKQESLKKEVEDDYEVLNNYGNKIYENYALVEDLLNSINKAAKEKGWDYVKDIIKSNEKLSKIVKKINPKNNEIILDL